MKTIAVICEGTTEHNYIQALNTHFGNEGYENITLIPITFGGCVVNNYLSTIHHCFAKKLRHRVDSVFIWLDKDIFVRANINIDIVISNILTKVKNSGVNKNTQTKVIFNTMNGEDMMMLHESTEIALEWHKKMTIRNHFNNPLISSAYMSEMKNMDQQYKKNQKIILNTQKLQQFKANNDNPEISMKSDISELVQMIIEQE